MKTIFNAVSPIAEISLQFWMDSCYLLHLDVRLMSKFGFNAFDAGPSGIVMMKDSLH